MEQYDIINIASGLCFCGGLWWFSDYAEKVKNTKWRILWFVPVMFCLLLTYIAGFDKCMTGAYIGSLLLLIGFVKPVKKSRQRASAAAAVCIVISLSVCLFSGAYRSIDYVNDFQEGFKRMKEHYVLSDHKQIDWDALYDKYLPQFETVNKEQDKVQNTILWSRFCAEFHDLHVGYSSDEDTMEKAYKQAAGNDYGLVIVTLADGKTAAVNVDPSLYASGIRNGTEVVSWNGMSPADADELSEYCHMQNYADEDNEKFYEGFFAAGTGDEIAELVYIDENGTQQTAELPKLSDDYYSRLNEAYETVNQGLETGHMTFTKLNDTTACLRIKAMSFDSISEKDNHAAMQSELREQILALKEEGVRDIVIDIRENGGGSGTMVRAIAQLFAPEGEHYYVSDAYWDKENRCYVKEGGGWKKANDITFNGENILGDEGRIVLLVTAHSASAADHLTKVMTDFDNTTVIGFTEPAGSAQGVTGIYLASGRLSYSGSLMLNRDGSIFIDSGTDFQSGDDIQIKVPFDGQALNALFNNGEDYLMYYSLEYLANLER